MRGMLVVADNPAEFLAQNPESAGKSTEWKLGDEVCALLPGGGYADYCVAPAQNCMIIPKGVSLV